MPSKVNNSVISRNTQDTTKNFNYWIQIFISSISYYLRLILWVGTLFGIIQGISFSHNSTVVALKSVISFILILCILIFMKVYFIKQFEDIRW